MSNPTAEKTFNLLKNWGAIKEACKDCNGDCAHCNIFLEAQKEKVTNA